MPALPADARRGLAAREGGDFGGGGVPVPKSDEELQERLDVLTESVQFTVVSYIRRGLFVRDKMTLATQVCLWVLRKNGDLPADEVASLISGRQETPPEANS